MRHLAVAGLILAGAVFTPFTASAQAQPCAIDLTDAIIALTQAQADAGSGSTADALAAITGVQADLAAIQERCEAADSATATFDLSETFTEPDMLSIDYPTGWFAGDFHAGLDWEIMLKTLNPLLLSVPPGGTVTVSSAEITSAYSPFVALDGVQSATVIVGSPMHIFVELGIYSEDFATTFLAGEVDFPTLLEELQLRIEQSPLLPTVELTSIEAERMTAGIEIHADDTSISMILVELDRFENRYALLVSPTTAESESNMLALLEAMAATVN